MKYLAALAMMRKIIGAYFLAVSLIDEAKKDDDKVDTTELFSIIMKVLESLTPSVEPVEPK